MKDYSEEKRLVADLNKKQSLVGMIISTVIALIPAVGISIYMLDETLPILAWGLPGLIMGGFIRLAISAHSSKLRIIPAATLFFTLGLSLFYFTHNPLVFVMALTNTFIVMLVARPKLSREEEQALWLYRQGKFEL